MILVKDNYLSKQEHETLYKKITSGFFPLYFSLYKSYPDEEKKGKLESFQFFHMFYNLSRVTSPSFDILEPILSKLNYKSLIRIKLNLNPYSQKLIISAYHQDTAFKCKGAIYYLNTNNGYTLFKEGKKKINSVKNRMIFFDSDAYHLGTNSTDCKNRLVLNFNYF